MTVPRPETIAAWTALQTASRVLLERVEGALKAAGLPPLAWYDALLEIERAGADGIRPFALKERLLLPQYGMSRLLDRIAAAGLIEKRNCAEDGRGLLVRITPAGRRARRSMWPIYGAELARQFETVFSGEELECLARLLWKAKSGVSG
ncbi:MarR family winged helix-turn-helix transcriptional regulator [Oceanibacterium hippocampi]|uniref:DNA-binding transcriptional repressor MarR n=1 Tax=Oceanibacterium hippocampi TaxID=745714 RepID=A0A1Y5RE94_9PROT|nr:MarR family winged helix-turn-helix transcriptional regulator [Oceanibacterium hippocampi]SLN12884.1 DNA-binding transcriptional repressor MarR [Oceanibacterium hippocampi]